MARILLVHPGPDFSVADVYRGWEKALKKAGHKVKSYNSNDRLTFYGRALMQDHGQEPCEHGRVAVRQAVPDNDGIMTLAMAGIYEDLLKFWPDIVFFVSGFYITAPVLQLIRDRKMKIVMLHTESPYQDDEQMERGRLAHLNLLNDPSNLDAWKQLGVPVSYMPHAYDPDVHFPAKRIISTELPSGRETVRRRDAYDCDFTFVGTLFKSRAEFFSRMDFTGLEVAFGGGGWDTMLKDEPDLVKPLLKYLGHAVDHCVDNEETARHYRGAKAGINFYRRESEKSQAGKGWAMGPREVEMAACGLFFLRDPRPESDEVFGGVLPAFSSPEEASELLRYWVRNDALREHMASMAFERIRNRTFDNNAALALHQMEKAGIL